MGGYDEGPLTGMPSGTPCGITPLQTQRRMIERPAADACRCMAPCMHPGRPAPPERHVSNATVAASKQARARIRSTRPVVMMKSARYGSRHSELLDSTHVAMQFAGHAH